MAEGTMSASPEVAGRSSRIALALPTLSRIAPALGATAVYAAGALFAYHRVLFASSTSMPLCDCGDQAQEVWFLRWPLFAIAHGLNPFYSTWMNYPKGFDVATNTASPLLALLSAPLQLTIGTVETYDVLLVVSFVASALAMCLAIRRFVRSWLAASIGGLLYGFSPYMIGQGTGHLFLVAVFLPPVVLVLLDEIVVAQRHGAVRSGLLLGVVLVLQYFISPEVLAMTVVVGACGVALLALCRPRTALLRAPHALVAAIACALVCAAALAYPVWAQLHGPQHVVGPPHPPAFFAGFPGDLLGPVVPTSNQFLAPAALKLHGDALVGHDPDENGMYLGIPLVVVLLVLARVLRRRRAVVFFVAMAAIAAILALGPQLVVDGHHTGVPLPAWVLEHLPLLKGILDVRFSLFVQMAAAAALAVGLDEMAARARSGAAPRPRHGAHPSGWRSRWAQRLRQRRGDLARLRAPALVAVVAVVALAALLPAEAYPPASASAPAFFTSAQVERVPQGAPVLTYPYVLAPDAEWSLTFQVEAGMRYKVFGADALVPDGPGRTGVSTPTPLAPQVVEHLFADAYTPSFAQAMLGTPAGTPPPPVDARTVAALRTFLRRYRVDAVVVDDLGLHPQRVVAYVADALGPPVETGGVWAWFDVPRLLPPVEAAPVETGPRTAGAGT
ncbi:MAG: hypothetical protein M0Z46_23015 [Actinomycetota bacterium]|nr:hypothetical protein [Actinomycetota bacterium]